VTQPLHDLRVVDVTSGPAGGLATMVLADFGAEVIKVEAPAGDPGRDAAHAATWLRGKRSLVCSDAQLHELIKQTADAVLTDRALDAAGLRQQRPDLVYGYIRTFGELPHDEGLVAARLGRMMSLRGVFERPGPVYSAVQVATHATAQASAAGLIAGLRARAQSGHGCYFETSLAHGLLPYEMGGLFVPQLQQRAIDVPALGGDPFTMMPTINYHPVQCADGRWLQLGNLLPHLLERFLRCVGLDDVLRDLGNQPLTWPAAAREAFRDRLLQHMQTRTAADWMALFVADGNIVAHPYQTTREALDDPDLVANGHVVATPLGRQLGLVARLDATPGCVGTTLAAPGELSLGAALTRRVQVPSSGPPRQRPLEGVTVVEFATIIAAPLGTSMLADLGARVIKVEPPEGDSFRGMMGGLGAARVNAGKESICIDLKSVAGRRIAHRLIEQADVLVHNYRTGVPERLGIGYAAARDLNRNIVYVSVNGYGPNGPGALRPSTHPIPGAALGGVVHQLGGALPQELLTGEALRAASRRIFRANEVNPDPNTSLVVATAVTLGLAAVVRNGVGQSIWVDMFGANAYANFDGFNDHSGAGGRPPLDEAGFGCGDHYRLYECSDGWVFVAARAAPAAFAAACATASRNGGATESIFRQRSVAWWCATLNAGGIDCAQADAGVPAERILAVPELTKAAQSRAWGSYRRHAPLLEFPGVDRFGGWCEAGEHTQALLAEFDGDAPRG
jgi:crotonobetainyl-CoA:carnitine CoA-transferase CaiB-like acyl-CoA transferase